MWHRRLAVLASTRIAAHSPNWMTSSYAASANSGCSVAVRNGSPADRGRAVAEVTQGVEEHRSRQRAGRPLALRGKKWPTRSPVGGGIGLSWFSVTGQHRGGVEPRL